MKYSAADPSVRPHEQLGLIVPWTVFNLLACAWFAALFVGLLVGPPARRNPTLLSLYAVFVIATLSGSALSWTGHVMTAEVPMPLCIVSGAFGSSTTLAQVSAAFAMVFKVWIHTFMIQRPPSAGLQWFASSLFPVFLPWILSIPFFITALIMGIMHNELAVRISPLYCTFNLDSLNTTMTIIAAVFEVAAIILAIWTGVLIVRARWRTRAARSRTAGTTDSYMVSLTIRTLIFITLLAILFIAQLSFTVDSFSSTTPDIIGGVLDFVAAGVFASDPQTLRMLRAYVPGLRSASSSHGPSTSLSITLTHQTHVHHSPSAAHGDDWKDGQDEDVLPGLPRVRVDLEAASQDGDPTKHGLAL